MIHTKQRIVRGLLGLAALGLIVVIAKNLASGAPNLARPGDAKRAGREAKPMMGGGVDEKSPLLTGNYVAGNGVVEPDGREINLAGQVPARIQMIHVKEGGFVKAGQVMVELDAVAERAAQRAAEADINHAKADLARISQGLRQEDIDALVAEADAARSRSELSSNTFVRSENLAKSGGLSPEDLDKAKLTAQAEAATRLAADARRRAAIAGSRKEDVLAAQAALNAAIARRDQAAAAVERLLIRSPIAGEVLQFKFRVGEYYDPKGEPIAVIGDTSKLQVRADIEERDIAHLRVGAGAVITADAFGSEKFSGKVIQIAHRMGRKNIRTDDPKERIDTKILEVVIGLDRTDKLVPGQRVVAFIDK